MGMTTKMIAFINTDLIIDVVETTEMHLCGKYVKIGAFTAGERSTVEQIEYANTDEDVGMLIVRLPDGRFITGHVVDTKPVVTKISHYSESGNTYNMLDNGFEEYWKGGKLIDTYVANT